MYREVFRLLYRGGLTGKFLPTTFFKRRFLVLQAFLISVRAIMALVAVIWDVWRQKTVSTYEVSTQKTEGAAVLTYQGRGHIRAVQKKTFFTPACHFFKPLLVSKFLLESERIKGAIHSTKLLNSDRSDRENLSTSKGGPVFSKLFRLDRTNIHWVLVEWITPCLVPRPHYYARLMRSGSRGPRKLNVWTFQKCKTAHACALRDCLGVSRPFVSDTSPKCIDREGLKRRRTGTWQDYALKFPAWYVLARDLGFPPPPAFPPNRMKGKKQDRN